jgi:hypothetical protein
MNVKESAMRDDHRGILVQRWIVVVDDRGREHLEARWILETPVHDGLPLIAA